MIHEGLWLEPGLRRSDVNGTPSFFINGEKQGSYSYDELAAAIVERLHAGAAQLATRAYGYVSVWPKPWR